MPVTSNIRSLYMPVQPTVKQSGGHVSYQEFLPDVVLQPFIYCYWELKTNDTLKDQFNYKVVADGCIDIFFELNNPSENFVMGFCKQYTEFSLGDRFHYVGVRFLPTMFPQLFKIDASELSNRYTDLKDVLPATSDFISEQFDAAQNSATTKQILDAYFLKIISNLSFDNDTRLYEAIDLILENYGVLNLEESMHTGISSRQLRRLFHYYIGDSAKTFCKVVRFQNILRAKPSRQSLRENKLFFDSGYYDQAHFIKDFRNFYGVTPAKAFGR